MKPLVIYHANCADGFGAAFAAWLKFGDEAEYKAVQYGTVKDWDSFVDILPAGYYPPEVEFYILDFSLPKDVMYTLFEHAKRVVWLDHHASVFKEWAEGTFLAGVEIKLSNGEVAYVDAQDWELVKNYSWSKQVNGGAIAYIGGGRENAKNEYMHTLILGKKDGLVVDHINMNTLDNRRCNLRYATKQQNGANSKLPASGFKGVTKHGNGWKAQITWNYSNYVIGTFVTAEEAAIAYDARAKEYFGEFARVNFGQKEPLPPTVTAILDNNKSGAMIAWGYFHPDKEIPMLIKHIDDYDRWQFKIEGTKEFNKALWSYAPWSFNQWYAKFLGAVKGGDRYNTFIAEGAAILRAHDANVQAVVTGATLRCIISDYQAYNEDTDVYPTYSGLAANCPPHLASDVGHQLANQSGTYGLLWSINNEGKCICSLRSNGDYDVFAIAKAFGGGGHKTAAGFEVDIQTLLEWIK